MDLREEIYKGLRQEVIGPGNTRPEYLFQNDEEQEFLLLRVHGSPQRRYGSGMLFPRGIDHQLIEEEENSNGIESFARSDQDSSSNQYGTRNGTQTDSNTDDPLGESNSLKPSTLGITFRVKIGEELTINIKSAFYERCEDKVIYEVNSDNELVESTYKSGDRVGEVKLSEAWIRRPINDIPSLKILTKKEWKRGKVPINHDVIYPESGDDWLGITLYNRSTILDTKKDYLTLTLTLENRRIRERSQRSYSDSILFQNELEIKVDSNFIPFEERESRDIETNTLNLLYRDHLSYALGHGVSVQWDNTNPDTISSSFLPKYELPVIGSNESSDLNLSMYNMSDQGDWESAKKELAKLIEEYEKWINGLDSLITTLERDYYQKAAIVNKSKCVEVLKRLKDGLSILCNDENSKAIQCFKWMNRAMVWQQQRSKEPQREWVSSNRTFNLKSISNENNNGDDNFIALADFANLKFKGKWRPFQLAFILMNIKSIISPESSERAVVDLIWFPTGGGKTEAYLGLCAFNIFYRRLCVHPLNKEQAGGTSIIMRYTLRLLTAQQFERASSLICACDLIRKEVLGTGLNLGTEPISIGLWVGGSTTPNRHEGAIAQYNQLLSRNRSVYNFIVLKCPCCSAEIGKKIGNEILGLKRKDGGKIYFSCSNSKCEYHNEILPIDVVDQYIYETPPTLLLGTVDKFAMLPWKANKVDRIFGFRKDNNETLTRIKPPDLIIQDELHLISGPLGSIVGLYETIVQTLCRDYSKNLPPFISGDNTDKYILPKIIASTATISKAAEQVKSLYATDELCLFPPQAINFGDTWFSEVQHEKKGRQYIGLSSPGYPSPQTAIVRVYASIFQKVKTLQTETFIDYYWTLVGYYNSIRELGGAVSLMDADIKERISQIHKRELLDKSYKRWISYKELTSRVPSSEIPKALKLLEESFDISHPSKALSGCLATNMIATGVDISRFGLMCIHGQPKTTSEYIQASSRVGRDSRGPGIVFTLYNHLKPRDKSQYEHFQSFHSRIYGSVEPTSVTPFTINVRERCLHAIVISLIRMFSSENALRDKAATENTNFQNLFKTVKDLILKRVEKINPNEVSYTDKQLDDIKNNWENNFTSYGDAGNVRIKNAEDGFTPLMYANSSEVPSYIIRDNRSIKTNTSMRGTDTESNLRISNNG